MKGNNLCVFSHVLHCVIRTPGGLLNVATKDQSSLTELPFGEVHPTGDDHFISEISRCELYR